MIAVVFILVYLGMVLGNLPGLALDRTGIALLGGIFILLFGHFSPAELMDAIDWSTIATLFGLMILSAQFYFSGFYHLIMQKMEKMVLTPSFFLLLVIFISGTLSAVLINDIVCLALTPVFAMICFNKSWNPTPFLLGLATSANIGSAITLIGNPQNILVSESIDLSFKAYFYEAAVPSILGLGWIWTIIKYQNKNNWILKQNLSSKSFESFQLDKWQIVKGILLLIILLCFFFVSFIPRYQLVLAAAGILLLSRKMASEKMLGFIDWQLIILFFGLFLINFAFLHSEIAAKANEWMQKYHFDLANPIRLYVTSFFLTNIVSNVPAVMLLLSFVQEPIQGTVLALSSTLAGNLFLTGSIANLIVIAKAKTLGIHISWKEHFKVGLPISVGSILLSIFWLYVRHYSRF